MWDSRPPLPALTSCCHCFSWPQDVNVVVGFFGALQQISGIKHRTVQLEFPAGCALTPEECQPKNHGASGGYWMIGMIGWPLMAFFALPEKMKNEIMVLLAKCPFPVTSFHQKMGWSWWLLIRMTHMTQKIVISLGLSRNLRGPNRCPPKRSSDCWYGYGSKPLVNAKTCASSSSNYALWVLIRPHIPIFWYWNRHVLLFKSPFVFLNHHVWFDAYSPFV